MEIAGTPENLRTRHRFSAYHLVTAVNHSEDPWPYPQGFVAEQDLLLPTRYRGSRFPARHDRAPPVSRARSHPLCSWLAQSTQCQREQVSPGFDTCMSPQRQNACNTQLGHRTGKKQRDQPHKHVDFSGYIYHFHPGKFL